MRTTRHRASCPACNPRIAPFCGTTPTSLCCGGEELVFIGEAIHFKTTTPFGNANPSPKLMSQMTEEEKKYVLQCMIKARVLFPRDDPRIIAGVFLVVRRAVTADKQMAIDYAVWERCRLNGFLETCFEFAFFLDIPLEDRLCILAMGRAAELYRAMANSTSKTIQTHHLKYRTIITTLPKADMPLLSRWAAVEGCHADASEEAVHQTELTLMMHLSHVNLLQYICNVVPEEEKRALRV